MHNLSTYPWKGFAFPSYANCICSLVRFFFPYLIFFFYSPRFSGTIANENEILKQKLEKRNLHFVGRGLLSFWIRLVELVRSLQFQFWKRQNNIYPSNTEQHITNINAAAIQTMNKEDYVGPCLQRLERLEKIFVELSNKPAKIPLEKEHLLTESLDRIKSVEFDLEKTKRVSFSLCV